MSRKQKEEVHRKIDESLEQLSVEERRKLEKELEIERLSGRTLMTMLSAGGGVVLVTTLVSATGFGAYMALTTIIHAVMTTFLGITVPFAVYTSATTILSILLGPIGLMVMLLTVVGFSGHRGQRRIDHLMLAYVVTQSHVAAGPETEPEEDFEESARHSEMAVELHRLQKDVEAYEGLLEEAAKKEERGYRTIQRLEARVAALEEREGTEEKVAALNAEIEELKQQLEIERNEKAALEAQSSRQKALLERQVQKRAKQIQARFETLYRDKFVVDEQVTRWFARLHDVKRVLEAERIMRNLSEGDHRHVRPNPKISSTALEAGFDDDGRLYFVRHNNTLRFVRIGDKHTQDRDIAWVKRNFP